MNRRYVISCITAAIAAIFAVSVSAQTKSVATKAATPPAARHQKLVHRSAIRPVRRGRSDPAEHSVQRDLATHATRGPGVKARCSLRNKGRRMKADGAEAVIDQGIRYVCKAVFGAARR